MPCSFSDLFTGACASGFSELNEAQFRAASLQMLCALISGEAPPYELQVSRGLISGVSRVPIFGHNFDIDTATVPEDVWEAGGLYPFQTSAQSLEILSDSPLDTALGTGARTVKVTGLDTNWVQQSETVSLNGVGVVPLTQQYLRINDCRAATSGSGYANAGLITLRVAGGGATQALIGVGDGRAMQAVYSVPAGHTLYLSSRELSLLKQSSTGSVDVTINGRNLVNGEPWTVRNIVGLQNSASSISLKALPYIPVVAKSDLRVTVVLATANGMSVTATFEALLFTN